MKTNIKEIRKVVNKKIKDINTKHSLNYKVKEATLRAGYMMEAHAEIETAVFDSKNIRDLFNHPEFFNRTNIHDIEVYITILLIHEIGHLLDYKNNSFLFYNEGYSEQLELNAWEIGRGLIDSELLNEYENYKSLSLESYKRDGIF